MGSRRSCVGRPMPGKGEPGAAGRRRTPSRSTRWPVARNATTLSTCACSYLTRLPGVREGPLTVAWSWRRPAVGRGEDLDGVTRSGSTTGPRRPFRNEAHFHQLSFVVVVEVASAEECCVHEGDDAAAVVHAAWRTSGSRPTHDKLRSLDQTSLEPHRRVLLRRASAGRIARQFSSAVVVTDGFGRS